MKKAVLTIVFILASINLVYANGWVQNGEAWMYQDNDGEYISDQVKKIDGNWYGFIADGSMATGFQKIGDKYYSFNADGTPKTEPIVFNGKTYNIDAKGNIKGISEEIFESLKENSFAITANNNTKVSSTINHAKELLGLFPSKLGLKIALTNEGITTDLIDVAINNVGVDWKDQAVKAAMYWLDKFNLDREKLKAFLIIDGFTDTEINYAVDVTFDDGKIKQDAAKKAITTVEIQSAIIAHYNSLLKK